MWIKLKYLIALIKTYNLLFAFFVLYGDKKTEKEYNAKTKYETSGNVIVKYIDIPYYILVLGIVSLKGKLIKRDVSYVQEWINRLEAEIRNGKTLQTSTNKNSERFID